MQHFTHQLSKMMSCVVVALLLGVCTSNGHIYNDPAAPIPSRVADLLAKMTTEEKVFVEPQMSLFSSHYSFHNTTKFMYSGVFLSSSLHISRATLNLLTHNLCRFLP